MSERVTGWAFVVVQAALLVTLVLLPGRADFDVPGWLRLLADVTFSVGVALGIAAGISLGRALTATPVPKVSGELRTGGLYRFARHPIYSGVVLIVVGVAARSGTWWKIALGVGTIVFFVVKTRWEEQRLRERFDGYDRLRSDDGTVLSGLVIVTGESVCTAP